MRVLKLVNPKDKRKQILKQSERKQSNQEASSHMNSNLTWNVNLLEPLILLLLTALWPQS